MIKNLKYFSGVILVGALFVNKKNERQLEILKKEGYTKKS